MKRLMPLLVIILFACGKKDDVKPAYVPKYATFTACVSASNPNVAAFKTSVKIAVTGSNSEYFATSQSGNNVSACKDIYSFQDNNAVIIYANFLNNQDCSTPITITAYYDNKEIFNKTYDDMCNAPSYGKTISVKLPNFGK